MPLVCDMSFTYSLTECFTVSCGFGNAFVGRCIVRVDDGVGVGHFGHEGLQRGLVGRAEQPVPRPSWTRGTWLRRPPSCPPCPGP